MINKIETLLTKEEQEYIKTVTNPMKECIKDVFIEKYNKICVNGKKYNKFCIRTIIDDDFLEEICIPVKEEMFSNMDTDLYYTLDELVVD